MPRETICGRQGRVLAKPTHPQKQRAAPAQAISSQFEFEFSFLPLVPLNALHHSHDSCRFPEERLVEERLPSVVEHPAAHRAHLRGMASAWGSWVLPKTGTFSVVMR